MTGSTVSTALPTMRWVQPDATSLVHVVVCSDRLCSHVEQSLDSAGHGAPMTPLSGGVHYWNASLGTATTATWEFVVRTAIAVNHDVSTGRMLDVNGDGLSDLRVGREPCRRERGRPHRCVSGARERGGWVSRRTSRSRRLVANGHFGWTIAAAGDVNGDGFVDVIVGAPDVNSSQGAAYCGSGCSSDSPLSRSPP